MPVEVGTGGTTKYNRTRLELPKTHWLDAACVGLSTPENLVVKVSKPLQIKSTGRGNRQRVLPNKYGFARGHRPRQKQFFGFQTGDIVKAIVPNGKYAGIHTGRVAVRSRPSFRLNAFDVHPKYLQTLQHSDGYEYAT